ncbi:MAG: hypothetical protein AVDCRST_MAG37-3165 [uncultured Rubrobacteraceae bacterium]|uniref:Uncharacterized protein n=1 Tax=uncultured Rubrobacteraceae bacterium TaxID=349277 RepID=A0A6J4QWM1_9ACTN|nr:MAG: hypothetical protein AVDCRST_MAG37-3165 [uncultured Rubrobacteraceae bacterium]
MTDQEELRLHRGLERRRIIERLNASNTGPTPHDDRVVEELQRENERRVGEAIGTVFIGGAAGGIGGDCGGGGGDGGGC